MSDAVYLAMSGSNLSGIRSSNIRNHARNNTGTNPNRRQSHSSQSSSSDSTIRGHSAKQQREIYPRTNMEIHIHNHFQAKVYTSGDSVTGMVSITAQREIPFDLFQIVLLGSAHTRVDNLATPSESSHVFLKLNMPIPEEMYPTPRVLEPGRTYELPFHFVIPNQLTLSACNHPVVSDLVADQHTRLPPTMGGGGNAGSGSSSGSSRRGSLATGASSSSSSHNSKATWAKDDLAPDMARVEYSIKARIFRDGAVSPSGQTHASKIVEAVHPLRILPLSVEDPPLSLTPHDRGYKLQTSKTIRKGLFGSSTIPSLLRTSRSKLGRVYADASGQQPAPLVIHPDGRPSPVGTTANIGLRFDPVAPDVPPPRVTAVSAKLTAHTYFSSTGMTRFPNLGSRGSSNTNHTGAPTDNAFDRIGQGQYSTNVTLLSRSVRDFQWEAQAAGVRRDSGYCSSSSSSNEDNEPPSPRTRSPTESRSRRSSSYQHHHQQQSSSAASVSSASSSSQDVALFYSAQLLVPLQLPLDKKTFLPTFHSCIVSRTYSLQLSITMAPGSTSSSSSRRGSDTSTTTVNLTIPVQVIVGNDAASNAWAAEAVAPGLPSFEAALEEAAADAHLRPRILSVPDVEFQQTSELPGYHGDQPAARRFSEQRW